MLLMLTTPVLVFICSYFAVNLGKKVQVYESNITNYYKIKLNKAFVLISAFILIFVSSFRVGFVDTITYRNMYTRIGASFENVFNGTTGVEEGFNFFMYLLNCISTDSQLLLIVTSIIINALIVVTIYKYSDKFIFSLFLYITSGVYMASMNGIRQFLVTSVMLFFIKYILEGKFLKYAGVTLILYTVHHSAILFIPIYFLTTRKAFDWRLITGVVITGAIVATGYLPIITNLLSKTDMYSNYSDLILSGESGASFLRVLVQGVPVILAAIYIYRKNKPNDINNICINFSILNIIFYILSLQAWVFARISMYLAVYNIILIPNIINKLFVGKDKKFVTFITFTFYFLYFIYQLKAYGPYMRELRLIF